MDFRKISNISVDCILFGLNKEGVHVLLSKRYLNVHDEQFPIVDDWMLTGDFVFKSERLDESAKRILYHYTGLKEIFYKQFRSFGNPERLKNDKDQLWMKSLGINHRTTSVAYYFLLPTELVNIEEESTQWFPLSNLPYLGFDHLEIITKAYQDLQERVLSEPLVFELLHDKFTLKELQFAFESVLGAEIDNRNFRKKITAKKYIVQLEEKRLGESKKPSSLYVFSRDIYEKTSSKRNIISF